MFIIGATSKGARQISQDYYLFVNFSWTFRKFFDFVIFPQFYLLKFVQYYEFFGDLHKINKKTLVILPIYKNKNIWYNIITVKERNWCYDKYQNIKIIRQKWSLRRIFLREWNRFSRVILQKSWGLDFQVRASVWLI